MSILLVKRTSYPFKNKWYTHGVGHIHLYYFNKKKKVV